MSSTANGASVSVATRDRLLARIGGLAMVVTMPLTIVLVLLSLGTLLVPETTTRVLDPLPSWTLPGIVTVFVVAFALTLLAGVVPRRGSDGRPLGLSPPIKGRCRALNSPADKVPSHGTHGYGQTYAIDLLHEPADGSRPTFGEGGGFLSPAAFPSFGRTVHAPCDGVVVAIVDRARDHRSRTSWLAYGYLLVESIVRSVAGATTVVGNHVVIASHDGPHVLIAHLRRGSARVAVGERVTSGQPIAQVGNSGNSSEPHVHVQVMDRPRPTLAAGLPFGFLALDGSTHPDESSTSYGTITPDGTPALPANDEIVTLR